MNTANAPVIEVVMFKLKPDVEEGAFTQASDDIQRALSTMPGYLKRELSRAPDGQWLDLVWWESRAHALQAMEAINASPAMAPFGSSIDFDSMTMLHVDRVRAYA